MLTNPILDLEFALDPFSPAPEEPDVGMQDEVAFIDAVSLENPIQCAAAQLLAHRDLLGCSPAKLPDDLGFMQRLADAPDDSHSPRMRYAGWRMLSRYSGALESLGIPYHAIPEPDKPPPKHEERYLSVGAGGDFLLSFAYEANLFFSLRAVLSLPRAEKRDGLWCFTLAPTPSLAEKLFEVATQFGFKVSADFAAHALKLLEADNPLIARSRALEPEDLRSIPGFGLAMYHYQLAGVEYALEARRVIIGDEMGLGKTRQFLAVPFIAGAWPAVLVCPASLKENWRREAVAAYGDSIRVDVVGKVADAYNITGRDILGREPGLVIINYDILADRYVQKDGKGKTYPGALAGLLALSPQCVGFDEGHRLRNPQARRTDAALDLAERAEYRLVLSGTPFVNRPKDVEAPLHVLGRLDELFGSATQFRSRYCAPKKIGKRTIYTGAANLAELNRKLRESCYVRRLKVEVLTELPPKTWAVETVQLTAEGRKEYDKAEARFVEWLEEQAARLAAIKDGTYIPKLGEPLPKAYDFARVMRAEKLVQLGILRRLASRHKLAAVQEWLKEFLESGEKIVVFAVHTDIVRGVARSFGARVIDGGTAIPHRQAYVDQFQSDDDLQMLVCNIEAGGVGLNMTRGSNVAFVELDWTPAGNDQAVDRCHRIGQTKAVTAWALLAQDTVDEDVWATVQHKRVVVTAASDGVITDEASSAQEEIIERLTQRRSGGS